MSKHKIVVPSAGESVTEATVAKFIAKPGSYVTEGEDLLELETDKASMELPSPVSGVFEPSCKEGDTVKVGGHLGHIDTSKEAPKQEAKIKEVTKEEKKTTPPNAQKPAQISEGGVRESMESYLKEISLIKEPSQKAPPQIVRSEASRKKMSKMRQTIASRLVQVKQETDMLTTFNEVDMLALVELLKREKENFLKKHQLKLTYLPFFIKAAVSALKEFPDVGAYIDGTDMVYSEKANIGIAVSTEKGLVVPVIKGADKLSFLEITKEITNLAGKARDRKLTMDEMSGGNFTITNGGDFGSMLSTPILNAPQSAILGMHNIVDRPVAIEGKVEIRPIMYLALSYDHRAIDGKESVQFLVHMKKLLEDPIRMILEQ